MFKRLVSDLWFLTVILSAMLIALSCTPKPVVEISDLNSPPLLPSAPQGCDCPNLPECAFTYAEVCEMIATPEEFWDCMKQLKASVIIPTPKEHI